MRFPTSRDRARAPGPARPGMLLPPDTQRLPASGGGSGEDDLMPTAAAGPEPAAYQLHGVSPLIWGRLR